MRIVKKKMSCLLISENTDAFLVSWDVYLAAGRGEKKKGRDRLAFARKGKKRMSHCPRDRRKGVHLLLRVT